MGLDAVELLMEVEDHFGISIQDSEAEHIRSVGDLVALIQSRIDAGHTVACPTLSSFLRLRTCVREVANNHQIRIRTRTRVIDVLTASEREQLWKRLPELLGSAPPGLRRPLIMRRVLVFLVILISTFAVGMSAAIDFGILPLTLALVGGLSLILHLLTVRFRTEPPAGLTTFGAIAQKISGVTVASKHLHLRSLDEILDELKPIIIETLGVDASVVVLDARLIEDLGMG